MKNITKIQCAALAVAMLLTGCSMPKIVLPGTPDVAATYGDGQTISTGEYLAYLYLNFEQVYANYSSYASYGIDPWTSEYCQIPYDTASGETVNLDMETYIDRVTEDYIKQNIVVEQMMKDNNLSLIADEEKEIDSDLAEMQDNAYLAAGFSNENFAKAYKALTLTQRSAFFGMYGEGGPKAVAESEIRKYFDTNYLSYKIITVSLTKTTTKDDGSTETVALTADEKAAELKKLNEYLTICNDKGFEAAMDAYNKANAKEGDKIEASKDEDNRINADATEMDEKLVKAIRSVGVGKAAVVEYGGEAATADKKATENTTAALIMRLDTNKPDTVYADAKENILISLKSEEFEKLVDEAVAALNITFNEKVMKKCSPKDFVIE